MILKFSVYLKDEKVKKVSPDIAEAKGLMKNGIEDFFTIKPSFTLSEITASIIFKDTYDSIRSVLQSFLAKAGYQPYSHEAIISFNLEMGNISTEEAAKLDKFGQLRNDVSYRAKRATAEEAREIQALGESLIEKLKAKIL